MVWARHSTKVWGSGTDEVLRLADLVFAQMSIFELFPGTHR
jgi:hypothetical protein